jgi:two-component system sensor histidine kinase ChiS
MSSPDPSLIFNMVMSGGLLALGLYHLGLSTLRQRGLFPLHLSAFCLVASVRTLCTEPTLITDLLPGLSEEMLIRQYYVATFMLLPVLVLVLRSLYSRHLSDWLRYGSLVLGILFSTGAMLVPSETLADLGWLFQVVLVASCVHLLITLQAAARWSQEGTRPLQIMLCVALLASFTDALGHVFLAISLSSIALVMLAFTLSYVLSDRLAASLERMEGLSEKLTELDKERDHLLSDAAGELRVPLSDIIAIADSMLSGVNGPLTERQETDLDAVVSSGHRLTGLVDDLVDLTQLENEAVMLQVREVDVGQMIKMVLTLNEPVARQKNVQLVDELPPQLPLTLADEDRLQEVIAILTENAIESSEDGQVRVGAGLLGETLRIDITYASSLEGPQEQALESHVAQRLLRLHGSELLSQRLHTGELQVTFALPISSSFSVSPTPVESALSSTSTVTRILVAEDEPVSLQALANYLLLDGHSVVTVRDGEEALRLLNEMESFDLALLDVMMPKLSGFDLCQRIRADKRWASLPIVMIISRNRPQDISASLAVGANDYLAAPFTRGELITRVNTLLNLQKTAREAMSSGYLASHDPLTGVANRRSFEGELEKELLRASESGATGALFFIDMDSLKHVNDTLGHRAGDRAIANLVQAMHRSFRTTDTMARIGGDEFAVLLPDVRETDAERAAQRLLSAVQESPLQEEGRSVYLYVSIGIALYPEQGTTADELLAVADRAMYRAKAEGGGRYHLR